MVWLRRFNDNSSVSHRQLLLAICPMIRTSNLLVTSLFFFHSCRTIIVTCYFRPPSVFCSQTVRSWQKLEAHKFSAYLHYTLNTIGPFGWVIFALTWWCKMCWTMAYIICPSIMWMTKAMNAPFYYCPRNSTTSREKTSNQPHAFGSVSDAKLLAIISVMQRKRSSALDKLDYHRRSPVTSTHGVVK